jgi:hypothetical protein
MNRTTAYAMAIAASPHSRVLVRWSASSTKMPASRPFGSMWSRVTSAMATCFASWWINRSAPNPAETTISPFTVSTTAIPRIVVDVGEERFMNVPRASI